MSKGRDEGRCKIKVTREEGKERNGKKKERRGEWGRRRDRNPGVKSMNNAKIKM